MARQASLVHEGGTPVCECCTLADTFWRRLKGLLGEAGLPPGKGIVITPARGVHTWFMRFPIDVVFMDRDLRVVGIASELGPWRFAYRRGARMVLELAAGEAARRGVREGQRLVLS